MVNELQEMQKETLKISNRLWGLGELLDKVDRGHELSDMMPTFLADHLDSLADDLSEVSHNIGRLVDRMEKNSCSDACLNEKQGV